MQFWWSSVILKWLDVWHLIVLLGLLSSRIRFVYIRLNFFVDFVMFCCCWSVVDATYRFSFTGYNVHKSARHRRKAVHSHLIHAHTYLFTMSFTVRIFFSQFGFMFSICAMYLLLFYWLSVECWKSASHNSGQIYIYIHAATTKTTICWLNWGEHSHKLCWIVYVSRYIVSWYFCCFGINSQCVQNNFFSLVFFHGSLSLRAKITQATCGVCFFGGNHSQTVWLQPDKWNRKREYLLSK